ncbi:MAG: flagellar hook-basal body protein [Candidatus Hydrogenedentes bacterium]|nr:flagellar hook-basal body protein [Candidatus Hydrogenedentota bacterium]
MILGLYAAANGMMSVEERQSVIANNIANAMTPGFKRQGGVQKGFYQVFQSSRSSPLRFNVSSAPGGGVKLFETYTNLENGAITTNGDPLSVALSGPAYIGVDTPKGERFTRNGKFAVDTDGQLVTPEGYKVQSASGSGISVSGGSVEIDDKGNVSVNGETVGQIRLIEFEKPQLLSREGQNLYAASADVLKFSAPATKTQVAPKSIELSNVQTPAEMVNMMIGLRAYAANQKVINAIDDTMGQLIQQVGSPI